MDKNNKKGQEEMVGFALIIIIVAVIILVFISFSLRDSQKETVESYEIDSFIGSFLEYTTDCRDRTNDLLTVKDLIIECDNLNVCGDGRPACDVLDSTLKGIIDESWKVGADRPIKGYELNISSEESNILSIEKGNKTLNLKEAQPDFSKSRRMVFIRFRVYY